jgi:hypothetical protein
VVIKMNLGHAALSCRCLQVPKNGSTREEFEDGAAWDCATGRFAVADGATESIYAGEWAAVLGESFVADPPSVESLNDWLGPLQRQWFSRVNGRSDSWYVEEKLRDGAFATLLGLAIDPVAATWLAISLGDSCLFHIKEDRLALAFPIEKANGFGARPSLIGSRRSLATPPAIARGSFLRGEQLFLMTDALAEWFHMQAESGCKPWGDLRQMSDDLFPIWIDALRTTGQMKNDDVTLLTIERLDVGP